jgi:putative ATP-dependent DNA ligase
MAKGQILGKTETVSLGQESYLRYREDEGQFLRGTAVFGERTIFGYPKIGRILNLANSIKEHFLAPFWLEEKIDGYNVRLFRLGDEIVALSRGGYVCHFTMDRIEDLLDTSIFAAEPDLVLCAEIAGPDNPYHIGSPPFIRQDVRLFVFDIMRVNETRFLSQQEKIALLDRYHLPAVENFGRFTPGELDEMQTLLARLNEEGREGVVLKEDSVSNRRAKYVTGNSCLADIQARARDLLDLPEEYFTSRVLRLGLYLHDQGQSPPEAMVCQLGHAILDGLVAGIHQYHREHKVYHTYQCRFHQRDNALRFLEQLRREAGHQVQISQRALQRMDDYWLLKFDRIYPVLTGFLGKLFGGSLVFD